MRDVEVETANGVIRTETFNMKTLKSLGLEKTNFEVQVYDFVAHGITSNYNGVLGLDFFEGKKVCIDLKLEEIELT